MWDPISTFLCMWILNINMPKARLSVDEVIKVKEEQLVIDTMIKSTELRTGI